MQPNKEQIAAAKKLLRDEYPDCWASPVETIPRVAALIARAESAEAERDRYKAALTEIAAEESQSYIDEYQPMIGGSDNRKDCYTCTKLITAAAAALAAGEGAGT